MTAVIDLVAALSPQSIHANGKGDTRPPGTNLA